MACTWYVAKTKPSAEELASRDLAQQGFKTFIPMSKVERRRRDGLLVMNVRPLFVGYTFVSFDRRDPSWKKIYSTNGVMYLVGSERERENPTSVPERQMARLFSRLAEHGGIIPLDLSRPRKIAPGDLVKILFGPYRDQVSTVQEIHGSRVDVLLRFAGAQRRSRLSVDCVGIAPEALRAAVR